MAAVMSLQRFQKGGGYDEYYGFRQAPFSLTPDPNFVYNSPSHERALQTILHGLARREGLLVITGDIGCGKTTLCRRLLPMLPPRTFLSLVLNPFLAADDLLKQVLEDFGLVSSTDVRSGSLSRASAHDMARTLHEFLKTLGQMNGTAVIIVDEAQNLPLRTLEQIRLLSNFETETTKLLQIILVGQRNLEPILALEEMRQLNQRVSRKCRIEPLNPSEVSGYIDCRLTAAMVDRSNLSKEKTPEPPRVHFAPAAVDAITKLSGGVPRIINLICDRALEVGHAAGAMTIEKRTVLAAATELELPIPSALRYPALPSRRALMGAAAALVIGLILIWFMISRGSSSAASAATGPVSRQTSSPVTSSAPPAAFTASTPRVRACSIRATRCSSPRRRGWRTPT